MSLQAVYGPKSSAGPSSILDDKDENLIKDPEKILERWADHLDGVLNRLSKMNEEAIGRIPQIDVNTALGLTPTLEEVTKAIKSLSNEKALGADAIPAEIFSEDSPDMVDKLFEFFQSMWTREELHQEYKDPNITHLYKNKGNRQSCDNHRGISLIAGKILAMQDPAQQTPSSLRVRERRRGGRRTPICHFC